MAHGKTLLMRNMRPPIPIIIHRHVGAPRHVRRNKRLLLAWKGSFMNNGSYINNARDLRKDRRLRGDS